MIPRPGLLRSLRLYCNSKVNFSSKPNELVFFTNDIVVSWHPEPKFPYECSKPLPEAKPSPESILKITEKEVYQFYSKEKSRAAIADELAKMTYTTRHIWFPRARDKKAKDTKPDRPYL